MVIRTKDEFVRKTVNPAKGSPVEKLSLINLYSKFKLAFGTERDDIVLLLIRRRCLVPPTMTSQCKAPGYKAVISAGQTIDFMAVSLCHVKHSKNIVFNIGKLCVFSTRNFTSSGIVMEAGKKAAARYAVDTFVKVCLIYF